MSRYMYINHSELRCSSRTARSLVLLAAHLRYPCYPYTSYYRGEKSICSGSLSSHCPLNQNEPFLLEGNALARGLDVGKVLV